MTAGDMLLMMVKTRSELANRWCVITVEQAEALADLVEAASRWDRLGDCNFCTGDKYRGHDITCPIAVVERVFKGDDHASE